MGQDVGRVLKTFLVLFLTLDMDFPGRHFANESFHYDNDHTLELVSRSVW